MWRGGEGESSHVMIEVGVFIRRCVGGHLGVYALDVLLAIWCALLLRFSDSTPEKICCMGL